MTALQHFHEGQLTQALALQQSVVAERPLEAGERLLLAELHLFAGDFSSVRHHLDLLPTERPGMDRYREAWHQLLTAESKRQRLAIEGMPAFLIEPPESVTFRVQALEALRDGNSMGAMDYLDEADAATAWVAGHVDGREFDGVRDSDDLIGPMLELFVDDQYVWFPVQQVRRLRMGKIESPRDLYFVPGWLTARNGEEWPVHLPSLYVGSHQHGDDDLRVGHATDWFAEDDSPVRGIGLRILHFGEEELSLRDFTQWEG